jgi:hypothetical protein
MICSSCTPEIAKDSSEGVKCRHRCKTGKCHTVLRIMHYAVMNLFYPIGVTCRWFRGQLTWRLGIAFAAHEAELQQLLPTFATAKTSALWWCMMPHVCNLRIKLAIPLGHAAAALLAS